MVLGPRSHHPEGQETTQARHQAPSELEALDEHLLPSAELVVCPGKACSGNLIWLMHMSSWLSCVD